MRKALMYTNAYNCRNRLQNGNWLNIISVMIRIMLHHLWKAPRLYCIAASAANISVLYEMSVMQIFNYKEKNKWPVYLSGVINVKAHPSLIGWINSEAFYSAARRSRATLFTNLCQVAFISGIEWPLEAKIGMKRSAQFEKTMSHGVNAIHVINDIQPFTDDKLLRFVTRATRALRLLRIFLR